MRAWLTRNAETVLFASAVFLLIALTGWWFVFLQRSVSGQYDLAVQNLALTAVIQSQSFAKEEALTLGPIPGDDRFALCPTSDTPAAGQEKPLKAYFDGEMLLAHHVRGAVWLCTQAPFRDRLKSRKTRISAMLFGEGLLLTALMLAVMAMLYRLVRSERRFRAEMQGFLRRVTHEMKTPIAGIKAVLQTIQLGRMPPEQLGELATKALAEAEREELLIQNLLVAQRLRFNPTSVRQEELDIGALVQRLVRGRESLSSTVDWTVTVEGTLKAAADASSARTVLDNLLDNAAKYGGGAVNVSAARHSDRVVVTVADEGVGFAPERASDLFEPFVRSNDTAAAARTGTGLGLSISAQLATAMGGGIEAHSDGVGKGARFTFWLPAWEGA